MAPFTVGSTSPRSRRTPLGDRRHHTLPRAVGADPHYHVVRRGQAPHDWSRAQILALLREACSFERCDSISYFVLFVCMKVLLLWAGLSFSAIFLVLLAGLLNLKTSAWCVYLAVVVVAVESCGARFAL